MNSANFVSQVIIIIIGVDFETAPLIKRISTFVFVKNTARNLIFSHDLFSILVR